MAAAPKTEISFGDWSAWVTTNDERVEVYSVKEQPELRKTICYIEARDGQAFKVHTQSSWDHPYTMPSDMVGDLRVDGRHMCCLLMSKGGAHFVKGPSNQNKVLSFDGLAVSHSTTRPFLFAKPALTDDVDAACEDEQIIKNLGTIQILLRRGDVSDHIPPKPIVFTNLGDILLNEKSKKVLSHQARLGDALASAQSNSSRTRTMEYLDTLEHPFHIFEFRYMSRELLEIKGHVEPPEKSPSLSPAPADDRKGKKRALETITIDSDDDSDDPDEEVRRLQARIAELQRSGGKKKLKKEKEDVKVKREKGVKSEAGEALVLD